MKRRNKVRPSLAGFFALALATVGSAAPIRPLAQGHVVVGESPAPGVVPLYSPTILRLDSGRLVAGYTRASPAGGPHGPAAEVLLTSDDRGATWQKRAELPALQGRVFVAGRSLYYLSPGAGLPASRSDDQGASWTAPVRLTAPELVWQQTPANVWYARDHVYLAFERRNRVINAWGPSEKALVLLRAKVGGDLTRHEAWTFSSELVFADVVPGVRENAIGLDYFGVPFFPQAYPERAEIAKSPRRTMPPIGWVEPGVVQILDPNHIWFDPRGRTFHLLARAHTGGTGFACLTKVVEHDDASMTIAARWGQPAGCCSRRESAARTDEAAPILGVSAIQEYGAAETCRSRSASSSFQLMVLGAVAASKPAHSLTGNASTPYGFLSGHRLQHHLRMAPGDQQEHFRRAGGGAAALFPIFKRAARDAQQVGKFLLRQAQAPADVRDIGGVRPGLAAAISLRIDRSAGRLGAAARGHHGDTPGRELAAFDRFHLPHGFHETVELRGVHGSVLQLEIEEPQLVLGQVVLFVFRIDVEESDNLGSNVPVVITRMPPRLPRPGADQRSLRRPLLPGMTAPESG